MGKQLFELDQTVYNNNNKIVSERERENACKGATSGTLKAFSKAHLQVSVSK